MNFKGPHKLVKRAKFVAKLLNIDSADLEITIDWSAEPDFSECQEHEDGSFTISICDWLTGQDLIQGIGHEMCHVWQKVRGDLITLNDEKRWIWKGQMYVDTGGMEEYFLRPWELEARSLEAWIEWRWRHR